MEWKVWTWRNKCNVSNRGKIRIIGQTDTVTGRRMGIKHNNTDGQKKMTWTV